MPKVGLSGQCHLQGALVLSSAEVATLPHEPAQTEVLHGEGSCSQDKAFVVAAGGGFVTAEQLQQNMEVHFQVPSAYAWRPLECVNVNVRPCAAVKV